MGCVGGRSRVLRRDNRHYPRAVLVAAHHRVPKHSRHDVCLPAAKIRGFRVENREELMRDFARLRVCACV